MVNYQSHEVMLEILGKVQPYQVEIIRTGRHCHIDGGLYRGAIVTPDHVGFEVTVFEDTEIVRQFEFDANMSSAELTAEIASLKAYVDRIKEEEG